MSVAPTPADLYQASTYTAEDSVGYLMKRIIVSIIGQADRELEQVDLTSAQWFPLVYLRQQGCCNVAELARWSSIDAGSMTRLLDRLEKKGLCRRDRSTDDRRVVHVVLTPEGEAAAARAPEILARVMNAHLSGFSHDEWQTLKGFLRRMVDNGESLRQAD